MAVTPWILLVFFTAGTEPQFPRHTLEDEGLKLTIDLPDAKTGFYRGARFDWSGLVVQAEVGGHTVFGYWKSTHNPNHHEDVAGTAEEFGHDAALGYDDAPVGGTFLKIGVGELIKPKEAKYAFYRDYAIARPGVWTVTSGNRWIEFRQELAHASGYGYRYVKRIELNKRSFVIRRELTNTGTKRIDTDHYGHNFMTVDADAIGPNYALRFPFAPKTTTADGFRDIAAIRDHRIVFLKPLNQGSIQSRIVGFGTDIKDNCVTIEHDPTGVAIDIVNDQPLAKFNLWSVKTALCPEPYVQLRIGVGETAKWQTLYEFKVGR